MDYLLLLIVFILSYGSLLSAGLPFFHKNNPEVSEEVEKQESSKKLSPTEIRWIVERSCLRKKNLSLEQANTVVDIAMRKGKILYFYKCDFCMSYHMTSKAQIGFKKILEVC